MMERWWTEDRRFGTAIVVSLFLHAVLALMLPNFESPPDTTSDSLETISVQRLQHISVQQKHVVASTKPVAVARSAPRPHSAPARASRPVPKGRATKPNPHAKAMPTPGATADTHAFAVARQQGTPAPVVVATSAAVAAAPVQTASPAPAVREQRQQITASSGNGNHGGNAPLLDYQDPVLEQQVSDELHRRFKMNLTLVVFVGDDGKTKNIEFHPPGVSDDLKKQIRDLLEQAHWDAALCGTGLTCEGKATIKLY